MANKPQHLSYRGIISRYGLDQPERNPEDEGLCAFTMWDRANVSKELLQLENYTLSPESLSMYREITGIPMGQIQEIFRLFFRDNIGAIIYENKQALEAVRPEYV